jgi:hypothetical protein
VPTLGSMQADRFDLAVCRIRQRRFAAVGQHDRSVAPGARYLLLVRPLRKS